jgi:nickel/cobalt transporter (NicO) family protein
MSLAVALLLGLGLGLRHALDSDHLIVVVALIQQQPRWQAARVAALWGLGHTLGFFAVGLAMLLAGVRVPPAFEPLTTLAVALMLIGLGLRHLYGLRRPIEPGPSPAPIPARVRLQPLLFGVVHGLAGSAAIALIAATTIPTTAGALLYLLLFGVGTVLGMIGLTLALSRALAWASKPSPRLRAGLIAGAALLSVGLGLLLGFEAWRDWP